MNRNMKKIVASVLACCIVGGVMPLIDIVPENVAVPVIAMAVEGKSGVVKDGETSDGFRYEIYGTYEDVWNSEKEKYDRNIITKDYAVINRYTSLESIITVPDTIDDVTVTKIDTYAFGSNSNITDVTLPDTIKEIGVQAFYNCTSLVKIDIQDGVTSISDEAFHGCNSLVSVVIPDSVLSIGEEAFKDCHSMVKIKLPANIKFIESGVFSGCSKLVSIDIPESVTTIKSFAFANCSSLTKLVIPDSVLNINGFAFSSCSGLTSVKLPKDLTSIPEGIFYGCTSIISIDLPDSVVLIGSSAFQGCTSLNKIVIPDGVTKINGSTFQDCAKLKNVTIPDSVEIICTNAFMECDSLKNITVPETVTILEDKCFGYHYSFGYEPYGDVTITGHKGSSAETYANENGIIFIDLDEIPTTSEETEVTLIGDANEDGFVDLADATSIIQHIGNPGRYALSEQGLANADCNSDNKVTGADAIAIQKLEAGMIDKLPYTE